MVGKVFKIMAFTLFGIAFALAAGAFVGINANSEVGGWLMLAAGIVVIIAALCAVIAIIFGKGGTIEKTGKFVLLSSPFLIFIVILGATVLIGGALVMMVIYCAGSILG